MPKSSMNRKTVRCSGLQMFDVFGTTPRFKINGSTNYKTVFGFFWTLLTVAILIGATVYYSDVYTDKTRVNLTSEYIQSSIRQFMNLTEKGIFFVMAFKQNNAFVPPGTVDGYFHIEANMFTATAPTEGSTTTPEPKVQKVFFSPCQKAGVQPVVNGKPMGGPTSRMLSDFGYCSASSNPSLYIDGDEESDQFTFIEIRILPCMGTLYKGQPPIPKGSCWFPTPTKTTKLGEAEVSTLRSGLRGFEVVFGFVDASIQPENYDNPIFYKLNVQNSYCPMVNQEKVIDVRYKQMVVNTDKGVFWSDIKTEVTYSLQAPRYDSKDRGPNDMQEYLGPTGKQVYPVSYMTLQIRSGNEVVTYTRKYTMLLDIIGLVGGVSEIITTVILILYGWYNGIMMEREKLNQALVQLYDEINFSKKLLTLDLSRKSSELRSPTLKSTSKLKEMEEMIKDSEITPFTFGEVFKFTYTPGRSKLHPKWKLFNRCATIARDNTDITKIVKGIADIESLRDAFFTKEHKVLLPYVETYMLFRKELKSESQLELEPQDPPHLLSEEHLVRAVRDRKSTRLNSSHSQISYSPVDCRIAEYLLARSPINPAKIPNVEPETNLIVNTEEIQLQVPDEMEEHRATLVGSQAFAGDQDPLPE